MDIRAAVLGVTLGAAVFGGGCVERSISADAPVDATDGEGAEAQPIPEAPRVYALEAAAPLHQIALAGAEVPDAPAVRVLGDGMPLAGVRVRFTAEDDYRGDVRVMDAVTDAAGIASAEAWTLGPYHADYEVFAALPIDPAVAGIPFTASTTSDFELVLHGVEGLDPLVIEELDRAVRRWQGAIVGAMPQHAGNLRSFAQRCRAVAPNQPVSHHGLHVFVKIEPIERYAGLGGVCVKRPDGSPAFGVITLDQDSYEGYAREGILESLMLHELGHTLGVGTLWEEEGLLDPGLTTFIGPQAQAVFEELREGSTYGGPAVPVEAQVPGSEAAHWSEAVCGAELMTSLWDISTPPLSLLTLASLQDLGFYAVNMLAFDIWRIRASLTAPSGAGQQLRCGGSPSHGP